MKNRDMSIQPAAGRRKIYRIVARMSAERDRRHPERACLPVMVTRDMMREFAGVAPRQTQWSYDVPGVGDGGMESYDEAQAACRAAYRRTGVTHAIIYAYVPGVLSVIHLWAAPAVVRQYLQTGDESLREAAG